MSKPTTARRKRPKPDPWAGLTEVPCCGARPGSGPADHATLAEALAAAPEPTAEQYRDAPPWTEAPARLHAALEREAGGFAYIVVDVVGVTRDGAYRRVEI